MTRSGGESNERRGRGQPAVAVLRSEADFSDPQLSRERRWLALFLLVHLVDEHGRMGGAYRRVLRRAGRVPGHWAHGRSLGGVRAEVSRWIGIHARPDSVPQWERVADLIHDAVHPRRALDVLATARYLHCLATGEANDAELHRPDWLDPEVENITTTMIGGPAWARKHGLSEPRTSGVRTPEPRLPEPRLPEAETPEAGTPEAGTPETGTPETGTPETRTPEARIPEARTPEPRSSEPRSSEPVRLGFEPPDPRVGDDETGELEKSAYQLLWSVVRVHREAEARIAELEQQVRELNEENARLSGDVTNWLGGYRPAIPDQERRTRSRRPVSDHHLALEDPAQAFTYPLPAELPAPRLTS